MFETGWIWIPIVLAAAAAQTVRNAAQRSLVKSVGTLAATLVRFVYGLPFAAGALIAIAAAIPGPLPAPSVPFVAWVALGAVAQLAATAFLIAAMEERSFVVAVTYSKTEIVQIGLYSIVLLGEPLSLPAVSAIALASVGVVLLSVKPVAERGSASGAVAFLRRRARARLRRRIRAVGGRLSRGGADARPSAAVGRGVYSLVWAQCIQTVLLGGYLALREPARLVQVLVQWRVSTLAGFMGALASMGWLTAFAMRSAVDVRIVGLVEVIYSYAMSRRFFAERVTPREVWGMALVVAGIVVISTLR